RSSDASPPAAASRRQTVGRRPVVEAPGHCHRTVRDPAWANRSIQGLVAGNAPYPGRRWPGSMAAPVGTRPAMTWRSIAYGNKTPGGPRGAGRSWSRAAIGLAAAGLAALGAVVLTGAPAVAASALAGAASAQAAAGTAQIYWTNAFPGTIGRA